MGSVKDLVVLREPQNDKAGVGRFIFSDRYSVFDWGEMPDHITGKGKAICIATAYFFEKLEGSRIKTHYMGIVEDGKSKRSDELKEPRNVMEFKLLRVIKPKNQGNTYDYSIFQKEKGNFLIPLEIIYRNSLPEGSSVFRRLREGSLKLEDIGLKEMPAAGQVLDEPILDVSTKLEVTDRYISWEEARKICNLTEDEIEEIKRITLTVNELITRETKRIGLFNEDGKVEFGFDEKRNLILVDALGTLDECRFTYEGMPVSKEIARIFYRKTSWYKDVEFAKKQDRYNWKVLVRSLPSPLPKELANSISNIYKAYTNELTERKWFDVSPLKEVLNGIRNAI
ncbi:phosphoribosylaminoimidazolesuccinocarboxamide synthase [Candidatus Aerophobetes bacterium]|nr:phosphoribosylaminoimidazolesuccinocarboxamide synthase [Candidatus Aerophobetes bacterium]